MRNSINFTVKGRYALFTDPLTRAGGEKYTYQIPTYQALKGIVESVYWKPTIIWVVDKVRVMKSIRMESKGIRPIRYHENKTDLSKYTYLKDVEYQIVAHFEWNMMREDLKNDRNENKHYYIAKRMIERGGRRDVFLGTRECQAYVEPTKFGSGVSFYDKYGDIYFDNMFHGFNYPDETQRNTLETRFWRPIMTDGVIQFLRPEECEQVREIRKMEAENIQTIGIESELLEGYDEGVIKHELDSKTL